MSCCVKLRPAESRVLEVVARIATSVEEDGPLLGSAEVLHSPAVELEDGYSEEMPRLAMTGLQAMTATAITGTKCILLCVPKTKLTMLKR